MQSPDIHITQSGSIPGLCRAEFDTISFGLDKVVYARGNQGFQGTNRYQAYFPAKDPSVDLKRATTALELKYPAYGAFTEYAINLTGLNRSVRVLRPVLKKDKQLKAGTKPTEFWLLKSFLEHSVLRINEPNATVYLQHEVTNQAYLDMARLESSFNIQQAESKNSANECIDWLLEKRPKSEWWTPYTRLRKYAPDVRIFYIKEGNQFKAAITLAEVTPEEYVIPWIYVDEHFRGHDYGTSLIYEAILYTAANGKDMITLNTNTQKGFGGSEPFYRKILSEPTLYHPGYTGNDPSQAGVYWFINPHDYMDKIESFISTHEEGKRERQSTWLTFDSIHYILSHHRRLTT